MSLGKKRETILDDSIRTKKDDEAGSKLMKATRVTEDHMRVRRCSLKQDIGIRVCIFHFNDS